MKRKTNQFYCPLTIYIPWTTWGAIYDECPVKPNQRDMFACKSCVLRGDGHQSNKNQQQPQRRKPEPEKVVVVNSGKLRYFLDKLDKNEDK